ncbi:MAG: lamin tail domain-containing protein [Verrucomicrobiota bacterium]
MQPPPLLHRRSLPAFSWQAPFASHWRADQTSSITAGSLRPNAGAWRRAAAALLGIAFGLATVVRLQAADVVISELMTSSFAGEVDEDGDLSDWIELYNAGTNRVPLQGWFLSDDPRQLTKWRFPEVGLGPGSYLVIYASGKDRTNTTGRLHTNFKLAPEGEFLALTRPDGRSVASEFAPKFPPQLSNVSYGSTMTTSTEWLLAPASPARMLVPPDATSDAAWTVPAFDDSTWTAVSLSIGYDQVPGTLDPVDPTAGLADITRPGDLCTGLPTNSPIDQGAAKAIDDNPATKYVNFSKLNAGLVVAPAAQPSVVKALRFTSAADSPESDPTSFALWGSTPTRPEVKIAQGPLPAFPDRLAPVTVILSNAIPYRTYRLLFPTIKDPNAAVAVQIGQIEFLGQAGTQFLSFPPFTTSVASNLFNQGSSVYVRVPFTLTALPSSGYVRLRVRYDDGFVAWLNGTQVARANAPEMVSFDSQSISNRFRGQTIHEEVFDLTPFADHLHVGQNCLALQGLKDGASSPDFFLDASIEHETVALGELGYLEAATPGQANGRTFAGLVADPVPSPARGFFDSAIDVSIETPTPGTIIKYTTDGTLPSATNGLVYSSPIHLTQTTALRLAAFREGWHSSRVITHSYFFLDDIVAQTQTSAVAAGFPGSWGLQKAYYGFDARVVGSGGQDRYGGKYTRALKDALRALPTLSIVMKTSDMFGGAGLYANPENRSGLEAPTSLEFIYPDGRPGFQQDAGIRIQGGAFRMFFLSLKKSFRVIFRQAYGAGKLRFPLFGPDAAAEFDNIVLRAGANDAWNFLARGAELYVRDAFAMETARAMGMVASHSTFVHLYINGQYWGLYNPVERPDAAFSATYVGGDQADWDALNQDSVPDGDDQAWKRLSKVLAGDTTAPDMYQRLQGNNPDGTPNPAYENLIDMQSMIDYLILNFYAGNIDWPERNWWIGRNRREPGGFKFYPWDTESIAESALSFDNTSASTAVAGPYGRLRTNPEFRIQFADRVYHHFFNGGALYVNTNQPAWNPARPENNRPAARLVALADQVREAVIAESARWGAQLRTAPFTRDEHWQPALSNVLTSYLPRRGSAVLNQFRTKGLYPRTQPPTLSQHGGQVTAGFALTLASPQGSIFYTLDGTDPRSPSALRYVQPIVLNHTTTLKTRVLNGTEWSALDVATFETGTPRLVISEVHYHPTDPTPTESAGGFTNDNQFEFIELWNAGSASYDLTGLAFTIGIQFQFDQGSIHRLDPGQYLLVVRQRAAFERRYGPGLPVAGEYTGQLDNSGERVRLVNSRGETVIDLTYETQPPWPETPDGRGPSLELVDDNAPLGDPGNWRASAIPGGSPGYSRSLTLTVAAASSTELRFRFVAVAGLTYSVYATDAVGTESWAVIEKGEAGSRNGPIEIVVPLPANAPARFFRVSVP